MEKKDLRQNIDLKRNIYTVGIHSCRINSFEFINEDVIVYPCGVFLNKFNFRENKLIKKIKFSDSIIHSMVRCSHLLNYLVVASYNGDCVVLDEESFDILGKFKFPNSNKITHLAVSHDMKFICGSSKYYVDPSPGKVFPGALLIFEKSLSNFEYQNKINIDNQENRLVRERFLEYKIHSVFMSEDSICEFLKTENKNISQMILIEKIISNNVKENFISDDKFQKSYYAVKKISIDKISIS